MNDFDFLFALHRSSMGKYIEEALGAWDETSQRTLYRRYFWPETIEIVEDAFGDIGMLQVFRERRSIYIRALQLDPRFQGNGIGSTILSELQVEAERVALPLELRVLKVNPARKLYVKFGFEDLGESDAYYRMRWTPGARHGADHNLRETEA